jgi:hypothetical protein
MILAIRITQIATIISSNLSATDESVWLWGDGSEVQWGDNSFIRIF